MISESLPENVLVHTANGNAVFVPVCEKCGRFVKADPSVSVNDHEGLKDQPNATSKVHGRVQMIFEGFFGDDELC
jgi:hypothetical protein